MRIKYSKYKPSGSEWIGEIPNHWSMSRLKYETNTPVRYGLNISSESYSDNGVRFIRITDISEEGYLIKDGGVYLNQEDIPDDFLLKKYDVLFCRSGHTVGKSYIHLEDGKYSSGGYLVRFNFGDYYCSKFIFTISKTDFYSDWIKLNTVVSTIENVNGDKYSNFHFPRPPKTEQREIVKYIDQKTTEVDNLISITENKIELLKEQRASLINRVITKGLNLNVELKDSGIEWLGQIPKHWIVSRIGYVSNLITGFPWKSELFNFEEGLKIVRGENVSEGFLRWGERTRYWNIEVEENSIFYLQSGDIIISMDGSKVGKNYVLITEQDLPILLHQRMCRVRVNSKVLDKFICAYVSSEMFRYYINISKTDPMIPHITQKDIFDFRFSLPPLSEQREIVKYIETQTIQIDSLMSIEQNRIDTLKEYRQSFISEVITGKVRVCEENLSEIENLLVS